MIINKADLLQAIETEIEDRTATDYDGERADELKGLEELKVAVLSESSMTYQQVEWLTYLVVNQSSEE